MKQLPLGMRLQDRAVFAGFLPGSNAQALAAAMQMAQGQGEPLLYLHGVSGTGKSHLLQSICAVIPGAAYFPLAQLLEMGPGVLEGAGGLSAVMLDDLDSVGGRRDWELQLFGLYNECLEKRTRLAVAAAMPATHLGITLPDLRSRFAAMPHFALHPLDETEQREALRMRAAQRGIDMPEETLVYLQRHFARDMRRLHDLLDRLDVASLREQRRVTVPFIREVLGGMP